MILQTSLISGAGNTFHILFVEKSMEQLQQKISIKDVVRSICAKSLADGFIFLERIESTANNEYLWHFFNKDGSDAEMCGNAARCVGLYISRELKNPKTTFLLKTTAGAILINTLGTGAGGEFLFEIQMTPVKRLQHPQYFYCDTGVPHVVIPISNMNRHPLMKNFCIEIREHQDFQPRGTNVTLIDTTIPEKISAITYERGVEDFTQACGTGAMAAGFYLWEKMGLHHTKIFMPGGTLEINLENLSQPRMTGPAEKLGEFEYEF